MDSGNELTFVDYLRPIWRFKILIILVVAVVAAATYVITNRGAKSYVASTELYVGESSAEQALVTGVPSQSTRQVADEAGLVSSPDVAALVAKNLDLHVQPQVLAAAVQATPSATADFLTIQATTGKPKLAAELANAFAAAYLQITSQHIVSAARAQLASTRQQLSRANRVDPTGPQAQALAQQILTIQGTLAARSTTGQQLDPAAVPNAPVSPKPTRDAIFAAAIALALTIIVAYLLDRNDRRVRRLDELEDLFELPILTSIPHIGRSDRSKNEAGEINALLREPCRTLRVNLDLARSRSGGKVIMVTSALPAEGKSTIVRNLAIGYRDAGAKVALIEADLRRPALAQQFGINLRPGLSDALVDGYRLELVSVPDPGDPEDNEHGRLDVAVAGTPIRDPTALLTEVRLSELTQSLWESYDVILIDSPPLLAVSDGLPILGVADGVLIVVRAGAATRAAAARLRRTVERIGADRPVNMLGVVANDVSDKLTPYYPSNAAGGRVKPIVLDASEPPSTGEKTEAS